MSGQRSTGRALGAADGDGLENLARVYRKMWARIGASADVTEYLGPELLRVTRRYAAD